MFAVLVQFADFQFCLQSREVEVIDGQCVQLKFISPTIYEQIALCSNRLRLRNFRSSIRSEMSHV